MTVVGWRVSGAKDLRFIGRVFHKWGDDLRNERSAKLKPGGNRWKGKAQMIRETYSARGGGVFMNLRRYFDSDVWRILCVTKIILYWMRCTTLSQR